MRRMRVLAAALLLAAGCSSASTSHPTTEPEASSAGSASSRPVTDWPTYHGGNDRAGHVTTPALKPPLRRAWSMHADAALYAQPVVAAGLAIAATENNTVYAVGLADGRLRWQRHLAAPARHSQLPCGNIDPSGITGTPAYDAKTGLVFVATESSDVSHTLVALDARTGAIRWQRDLDVIAGRNRDAEQQRGALLVASDRVYVPFGGRYGDCGNYVGYLASVATDGQGAVGTYAVPTAREAGMWAPPGAVIGPGGDVYVASGNGAEVGGRYDGSDSVIRLDPTLHPLALFAPSTWRQDNAQDLDLGSMSPAAVGDRLVIAGKRGEVYLLDPQLRGIGGQLSSLHGCAAYGGAAVDGDVVLLPCDGGIRALRVTGSAMRWLWHNGSLSGSPVVAADAGYAFDGDRLVEFDLRTGHVHARVHVGDVTRFATPALAGGFVVVGTTSSLVAVTGG